MPNPKSALRFPMTRLFQRAADVEAAKYVAPQLGSANEIPEDPLEASNESSKTAAAEESAKYVAPEPTKESDHTKGGGSGSGWRSRARARGVGVERQEMTLNLANKLFFLNVLYHLSREEVKKTCF